MEHADVQCHTTSRHPLQVWQEVLVVVGLSYLVRGCWCWWVERRVPDFWKPSISVVVFLVDAWKNINGPVETVTTHLPAESPEKWIVATGATDSWYPEVLCAAGRHSCWNAGKPAGGARNEISRWWVDPLAFTDFANRGNAEEGGLS